jgi:RimJ/RimL family protein N-acetyltransferase
VVRVTASSVLVPAGALAGVRAPELVLEAPTERDADAISAACQDPQIQEWTTVPVPYERSDAEAFLGAVERGWADGAMLTWAIKDGDAIVGMIGLAREPVGSAEVGYWLVPAARGRGWMLAAVRAVVDHAFDRDGLGLERLSWQAYVGNWPSRRVAERAGFAIEGTIRAHGIQRGRRRDAWVGTLLRSDRPGPV